jgi:dCMP deaminase
VIEVPNVEDYDEIPLKLRSVYKVAEASDDQSTKNGAMLLCEGWNLLTGFNHIMEGYGHLPEHHERPFKYWITEHSERDVILKAAKKGIKTEGLTLVANWVACPDCARAIVEAGICCVVCHKQCQDRTPERWRDMIDAGLAILRSGGVQLVEWDGKIGDCRNLNNGKYWSP